MTVLSSLDIIPTDRKRTENVFHSLSYFLDKYWLN